MTTPSQENLLKLQELKEDSDCAYYRINCNTCRRKSYIDRESVSVSVTKNDRWRVTGTCLLCGKNIGSLVNKEQYDYLSNPNPRGDDENSNQAQSI